LLNTGNRIPDVTKLAHLLVCLYVCLSDLAMTTRTVVRAARLVMSVLMGRIPIFKKSACYTTLTNKMLQLETAFFKNHRNPQENYPQLFIIKTVISVIFENRFWSIHKTLKLRNAIQYPDVVLLQLSCKSWTKPIWFAFWFFRLFR